MLKNSRCGGRKPAGTAPEKQRAALAGVQACLQPGDDFTPYLLSNFQFSHRPVLSAEICFRQLNPIFSSRLTERLDHVAREGALKVSICKYVYRYDRL